MEESQLAFTMHAVLLATLVALSHRGPLGLSSADLRSQSCCQELDMLAKGTCHWVISLSYLKSHLRTYLLSQDCSQLSNGLNISVSHLSFYVITSCSFTSNE